MTTLEEVKKVLQELIDEEGDDTAARWIHNDIIKMKLAISYDAWMDDIDDHKYPLSLKEHIQAYIDEPQHIENPPD